MSRELLQQALDALETHVPYVYKDRGYPPIEALRAALARPEPEPVAWRRYSRTTGWQYEDGITSFAADPSAEPLYAAPVCNVPETDFGNMEPVGWLESPHGAFRANLLYRFNFPSQLLEWKIPLYAAPPAAPIDGFGGNLDEAFEPAAPADMVMVPKEPTHEMLYAMAELDGWRKGDRDHPMFTRWRDYWNAALAAAPAPAVPAVCDGGICGLGGYCANCPRQPAAPALPDDAALNTLAKLFHRGEEIEGDDGAAMMVDLSLWHEASEAFDSLIGEGDGETLASSAAPAVPDDIAAIIACLGDDAALLRETTDDSEEIAQNMDDAAAALERLSAAPAVREPLTDEQIDALWRAPMSADWEHREFARAIEAHHGIEGGGNG